MKNKISTEFTDIDDEEKQKVVGILEVLIGPDGLPLKRNNSDYNSFFFTNSTVRSFTAIDDFSSQRSFIVQQKMKKDKEKLLEHQETWKQHLELAYHSFFQAHEDFLKHKLVRRDGTTLNDNYKP